LDDVVGSICQTLGGGVGGGGGDGGGGDAGNKPCGTA